ncbi:translocation/assembly module TamB domain-containing protein [Arenimonas aestuarii]
MNAKPAAVAKARRWPRRTAWTLLALLAALALVLAWLLASAGGRDTTLSWLQSRLGEDALSWESAEGTLGGTLVLHGVHWQGDGVRVSADRLLLSPRPGALLSGALRLRALEADAVHVWLAPVPDQEPTPWTAWPELLPTLPLPFELSAQTAAVSGLRITRGDEPVFAATTLAAEDLAFVQDGLRFTTLSGKGDWGDALLKGHYLPADGFRTELGGRLRLVAPEGQEDAQVQLSMRGNVDSMRAEASGTAGGPWSLEAAIDDGRSRQAWTLDVQGNQIAPHWFGGASDSAPLDAVLTLAGEGRTGRGRIALTQGDTELALEDLQARFAGAGLALEQGRLLTPVGELTVQGAWDPLAEQPIALTANAQDLQWAPADGGAAVQAAGTLSVQGLPDDWRATLDATLVREGEQATLRATGLGNTTGVELEELVMRTPGGKLAGQGRVDWQPELAITLDARLDGLDPGYLLPDYPGAISGGLRADLRHADNGWVGELALDDLRGTLRGRAIAGRATLAWQGESGQLDALARLGESRISAKGRIGATLALDLSLQPLRLADLAKDAAGQLEGTLRVQGPRGAPGLVADLEASKLRWGDLQLGAGSLRGELPASGEGGSLVLDGTDFAYGDRVLQSLTLRVDGTQDDMALRLQARSNDLQLAMAGTAQGNGRGRRGELREFSLDAPRAPALALREPARWSWSENAFRLEPACVTGEGNGFLCMQAEPGLWRAEGEGIPLALAQPWLPDTGVPLRLDGELSLDAAFRKKAQGWNGTLTLASDAGGLATEASAGRRSLFAYRELQVSATVENGAVTARAGAALNDEGMLRAELRAGAGNEAAVSGQMTLRMQDLTWLELLSPDIVEPTGRLEGEMRISGTRAAPRIEGLLTLRELATELPALGLALEGGQFDLQGAADGTAVLSGRVQSGEGVLQVNGSLNLAREQPLELALTGDRVTFSDTPDLQLVASPALVVAMGDERLRVGGRIEVTHARVNLEALDGGAVEPSPDVVLVDAEVPRDTGPVLDLAVHVALADDVRLRGFGLDGALSGALDIRQAPGRPALATGTLQASGRYRAYGQDLDIRRARLAYSGSPVDNPTLDILAERRRGEVTVGVQVRGRALSPVTTIVSTPAMDTSEALSWLVFGRPLQSTSSNESSQLEASALALGVGGNLLAQQIGDGLGLDSAGVEESRALGGATFTVGKYLSPRLFLGYGISLVGRGQVVTLKYLLTRGFDITIESGTESAASLNWRTER